MARGYDVVVRLDGDGQHPAVHLADLLEPVRCDRADVVIGSRYAGGGCTWTPAVLRNLHRLLAWVLTNVTGRPVTDPTSGLWVFGPAVVPALAVHHPAGYPEPELRVWLGRHGWRVVERPVTMRPRLAGRTSLTASRAGAALLRLLVVLITEPFRLGTRRRAEHLRTRVT